MGVYCVVLRTLTRVLIKRPGPSALGVPYAYDRRVCRLARVASFAGHRTIDGGAVKFGSGDGCAGIAIAVSHRYRDVHWKRCRGSGVTRSLSHHHGAEDDRRRGRGRA